MIYRKFNQYIKKTYFPKEKRGYSILFSIDEKDLFEFLNLERIDFKTYQDNISMTLRRHWSINGEDFFGICAIQVFIVSQMHEEDGFSKSQYNLRLAKFLNINESQLQKLYREYQHLIWKKLKDFCNKNQYKIGIPEQKNGPWCYVKYPFSQALLCKEDLKKTTILFERIGLKQSEFISFDDFKKLIEYADNGYIMNARFYNIKQKLEQEFNSTRQLYQQIYNFYSENWDGSYPYDNDKENIIPCQTNTIDFHLYLNNTMDFIVVCNTDYEIIDKIPIDVKDLFNLIKKYHILYSDEILIFKIDTISEESEYVRKFELGERYVVICASNSEAINYISELSSSEAKKIGNYNIFITQLLKNKSKHHFWNKFFSLHLKSYTIEGGIKLAYKIWMLGCGPKIKLLDKSAIWINGVKFEEEEIDCSDYPIGVYKIIEDSSVEKFEIKAALNNRNEDCKGWKINKQSWSPVNENFQITGLICNFPEKIKTSSVRDWTRISYSSYSKTDYSSTVLKAIKRAKNGI